MPYENINSQNLMINDKYFFPAGIIYDADQFKFFEMTGKVTTSLCDEYHLSIITK